MSIRCGTSKTPNVIKVPQNVQIAVYAKKSKKYSLSDKGTDKWLTEYKKPSRMYLNHLPQKKKLIFFYFYNSKKVEEKEEEKGY